MNKKLLIPIALFTIAFMVVAFVLLLTGPRMRNQPSLQAFEAEMQLPPDGVVPFFKNDFDPSTIELLSANEENLYKGKVYYGFYCVFCHGEDGKGNGPVGTSYMPKPADLTTDSIRLFDVKKLYNSAFTGTGHSPVLERVVPLEHRKFVLTYIKRGIKPSSMNRANH